MSDLQRIQELEHVISALKAEVAEWALKYAEEVERANKAEESLKTAVTTTARTSKTILEERDALRVRANKAEAEVERLKKALRGKS